MKQPLREPLTFRITSWVGSPVSLFLHTVIFGGFFLMVWLGVLPLESMLLILTTIVSLEAIYLAIFIQMSVNENTRSLREVEEDLDEIQEDVEELSEDMDEIQEDLEEMQEDDQEEERRDAAQAKTLDQLTSDIHKVLADIESLKKGG
jgi:uncharacterized protein YoxC